uniref:Uncharacterized protein n=1 Tax=Arundo donax TaxID=35708 RepID=A0A0A9FJY8_ARUDO
MWKLKIAEGGPWLKSGNNHIGRETWEFDQNFGSNEEREAVHSELFLQLAKETNFSLDLHRATDGNPGRSA